MFQIYFTLNSECQTELYKTWKPVILHDQNEAQSYSVFGFNLFKHLPANDLNIPCSYTYKDNHVGIQMKYEFLCVKIFSF